jgi:arylsulfatase A-like enzyme
LLRGEYISWRKLIFTEQNFHTPQQWQPGRAVRSGRWKLIEYLATADSAGAVELYNLEKDPDERVNLANRPPRREMRDKLRSRLTRWRIETGDPLLDPAVVERLNQVALHPGTPVPPWYHPL